MPHILPLLILAFFGFLSMTTGPVGAEGTSDSSSETVAPAYTEAQAAIEAENYGAALPILTRLTADQPENADAWNLLGYTNRKLAQYEPAGLAYAKALELNPEHLGALEYQGELFLEMGQRDKAEANVARLRELCGSCEELADLEAALAG